MSDDDARLAALTTLAEPLRRRLYLYVSGKADPVSRDDAAQAIGVARSVAAFHLDKLADAGLLEVEYRRPSGRSGPGAGRPSKCYRRAPREMAWSAPERHYEVAASIFASALTDDARVVKASPKSPGSLCTVARAHGRRIASTAGGWNRAKSKRQLLTTLAALLAEHGYDPVVAGRRLNLRNCPFRMLADVHPDLVCSMNLDVIEGVLEEIADPRLCARLEPLDGCCCVTIEAR